MSTYVMLNFEDKIASTMKGAADSTLQVLTKRYEVTKQHGKFASLFVGKNRVVEHRCVDGTTNTFTTNGPTLAAIRHDCGMAEKIYIVAHGDPRTPDVCYTNAAVGIGVMQLATYQQLATFLLSVIPASTKERKIALVMCYGARCRRYQRSLVDHAGSIAIGDLASSFAYGLFYNLVGHRNVRLTAVTGKIQHDTSSGRALVEHEEMIDENMEFAEAAKAQTQSKGPLIQAYQQLLKSGNSDTVIRNAVSKYRKTPSTPTNPLEQYAHDLVQWENTGGTALMNRVQKAKDDKNDALKNLTAKGLEQELVKYGKFIYRYDGTLLTIASKYGQASDPKIGKGGYLYKGPLVPPT
ncbi:MAG: hypothetical protein NW208_12970 [Bryobacter sp.]|nr:hypothetical protein [Bryobacter sp.]